MKNNIKYWNHRNQIINFTATRKLVIIAIFLFIFIGCHERKPTSAITTFEVDRIAQKTAKMQEIIPDFTIVSLETNDESLIQYIKKVIVFENRIFILDDQRPIFAIFSDEGQFVQTIGRKGNGPGEFYHPTDFILDTKNKLIELYDGFRDQILIYDFNGKYLKSIRVPVQGDYFIKFEDESYLIYTNKRNEKKMPFKLVRVDKKGKLISKDITFSSKTYQTVQSPFVQIGIDKYIFSEQTCDTIFQITRKEIYPLCYINLGKDGMPFENRLDINTLNATANKYSIKKGSPMFQDNKLIIKYSRNSNPKYMFFSPTLNNPIYYKVINNYDFAFGTPQFSYNNKLIGIIHPTSVNLHKKDPQYALQYNIGDKIPAIEMLRKNLKITDNPCLIIWNSKNEEE